MAGNDVAIIVPVFREVGNIRKLVAGLHANLPDIDWEVVFVDDDSDDGTFEEIENLARCDARVRGLLRVHERGLSSAAIAGLLSAKADYLVVMDGDGQHDPAIIPKLLAPLRHAKADITSAARDFSAIANHTLSQRRRTLSLWANRAASLAIGRKLVDPMTGFFAIRSDAFRTIVRDLSDAGFKLLMDILIRSPALRHQEVLFEFKPRETGQSKLDLANAWQFASYLAAHFSGRLVPARFISFLAVGTIGLAVHFSLLYPALALGISFAGAQTIAAVTTTCWNFWLNNLLTFRDRRLTGWKIIPGVLAYLLATSIGIVGNVAVASKIHQDYAAVVSLSALAGITIDTVWKFVVANTLIWRRK